MTILIAPDKFKGSLTTFEACEAIAHGIRRVRPDAVLHLFPMADGGDGFAAVMKHYLHAETIHCPTEDALGRPISASYEWQAAKATAIIDVSSASGLARLAPHEYEILHASTYGTGLLIADAVERGARTILLGLGGSATNDAGMGILQALGFRFLDAQGAELSPGGGALSNIQSMVAPPCLPDVRFTIACDVTNPLYGPRGAAQVYARQKGATDADVALLDEGLRHYAQLLYDSTGREVAGLPGAGAAGGIAASLLAWFATTLQNGADLVLEASGILPLLPMAALVITGEGRLDHQSLQGKLPGKIQELCLAHAIPVAALCGQLGLEKAEWQRLGWQQVRSICPAGADQAFCMQQAAALLEQETAHLLQSWPQ